MAGLAASLFGVLIHPVIAFAFVYLAAINSSTLLLVGAIPFALGLIACLSVKWYTVDNMGYRRGRLPNWAYAWSTPDEDAPGDVRGEQWLKNVYNWFGPTIATCYWHLERNRGMGLSYMLSKKADSRMYLDGDKWGYQELPNGAWRNVWKIGSLFSVGIGNQTTMVNDQMWIRPWLSFKRQHGGNP